MKALILCSLFLFVTTFFLDAQVVCQFRGPERNGIYPAKELMRSWPDSGPELHWKVDGIGNGYSSPVVTNKRVFVTGEIDSTGYLSAFDENGSLVWRKTIGKEWMENFTGSRSTPTLVDDRLYICSSMGLVSCFDAGSGNEIWSVDMIRDLNGINIRFGYSSGLLVDEDRVYCNPGGMDTNIVALNRFTGKIIWKSKALGDSTAYGSPILINLPARKLLVTFTIHNMIGLDATTGELLWYQPQAADRDIQACTPVFDEGFLYTVNGSGSGAVKYQISDDGKKIEKLWENPKITDIHGGFVKIGNYLYSSQYRPRRYCSINCSNGEITDSLKFDKGAIISADGMLYCYTEKGMAGLVSPDNGKMKLVSSFKIPVGSKEFFTIPVIENGQLYIRHEGTLMAYSIHQQ